MDEVAKWEIFYVRHAATEKGLCEDRDPCDINLSELGERQLVLLAERFRGARFDHILASPLVRAVRTAAAVAAVLDAHRPIELMPELTERSTTENYAGCPVSYLRRYYDDLFYCPDLVYGTAPGVFPNDTKSEAMDRARHVIAYLRGRFTFGQRVLVVGHAAFGNSFVPSAVGIREEDFRMTMYNTSVTKVKFTADGVKRISFQNDISHLSPIMPDWQYTI